MFRGCSFRPGNFPLCLVLPPYGKNVHPPVPTLDQQTSRLFDQSPPLQAEPGIASFSPRLRPPVLPTPPFPDKLQNQLRDPSGVFLLRQLKLDYMFPLMWSLGLWCFFPLLRPLALRSRPVVFVFLVPKNFPWVFVRSDSMQKKPQPIKALVYLLTFFPLPVVSTTTQSVGTTRIDLISKEMTLCRWASFFLMVKFSLSMKP